MLLRSEAIILPRERTIRELMSKSLSKSNLEKHLETLKPHQHLVNILFDVVKLKQSMRFVVLMLLVMQKTMKAMILQLCYLVYDFVHVFKNLYNNWIIEPSKELTFNVDGNEYAAK